MCLYIKRMASTRNKNTPGDYALEKMKHAHGAQYLSYPHFGQPVVSHHPGNGLMPAKTCRNELAFNACDIESQLFGIGANNMEMPNQKVDPQLKNVQCLDVCTRKPVFVKEPVVFNKNQRPMYIS